MKLRIALIGLACALGACHGQDQGTQSRLQTTAAAKTERATRDRGRLESYADIVDRVAPAVVTVRSARRVRAPQTFPFAFPGLGRTPQPRSRGGDSEGQLQRGLGSGVIVSANGQCLTNHHVVDGAEEIQVELTDGRRFDAKLVGSDPPSDLAILKIEATNLPVLTLGDSNAVRVGDIVLAIGNPLGVGQTVTMGIISAKNRSTGLGEGSFEDFLQTDAPINQGNSGGALVNTAGQLIGINSQILSTSGGSIGIGFAVPSNMAANVLDQITKSGRVRRGQLGVGIQPLTPEISSALGISSSRGVLINSVTPGGAAERAGLRRGDVIMSLNGQPVTDGNTLRNRVAEAGPGANVSITVMREGKEHQLSARLGETEAQTSAQDPAGPAAGRTSGGARLGVGVEALSPQIASELGLRSTEGVVIREVDPSGAAAAAGLAPGDVIVEANRQPLKAVSDLEAVVQRAGTRPILLLVNRGGQTIYLTVTPKASQ